MKKFLYTGVFLLVLAVLLFLDPLVVLICANGLGFHVPYTLRSWLCVTGLLVILNGLPFFKSKD